MVDDERNLSNGDEDDDEFFAPDDDNKKSEELQSEQTADKQPEQKSVGVYTPPQATLKPGGWQYSVPPVKVDGISPGEARQALKQMYSDCVADQAHPYCSAHHFLHDEWTAYARSLHEIAAREPSENPLDAAIQERNERLIKEQEERYKEALKDDKKLKKLGYKGAEVPLDISPGLARALRMQRLNGEGGEDNLRVLDTMLHEEVRKFKDNRKIQGFFESYDNSRYEQAKSALVEEIIFALADAYREQDKKPKPTSFGG